MRIILSIIVAGLLAGCVSVPNESRPIVSYRLSDHQHELNALGREAHEFGLALSGGGLRSSLFAFGALKAFYDAGLLQEVDTLSAVSGGGYTAYSLMAHATDINDSFEFGASHFSDANYLRETCELMKAGNFVTTGDMARALFSFNPRREAIRMYHREIGETFGETDKKPPLIQMHELLPGMKRGLVPLLLVNATVLGPEPTGWADGLFEFSPLQMGNDRYGYQVFSDDQSFEYRQAVAISGAAFKPFLKQNISVDLPNAPSSQLTVSDGGHSENLGAVALVKRGVPDIVIIDAEHDPKYGFNAYANLKKRLAFFNSTLVIDSIDKAIRDKTRLETSFHVGKVTTQFEEGLRESNVYYIKMAMPRSLDKLITNEEMVSRGKSAQHSFMSALRSNPDRNGNWDCSEVNGLELNLSDWGAYSVASYSDYLNNDNYVRHADALPGNFFTAKFPQYTTLDQSFFTDQTLAFVGLGYLEMMEFLASEAGQKFPRSSR